MNSQELQILMQKRVDGTLTEEGYRLLADAAHDEQEDTWHEAMLPVIQNTNAEVEFDKQQWQPVIDNILQTPAHEVAPVRRMNTRRWLPYAAAILVLALAGVFYWNLQQKEKPSVTNVNPSPVNTDFAPGGNRATLQLADGAVVVLDSGAYANGVILKQGLRIKNNADKGKLEYALTNGFANELQLNTLTTPRGGQYQVKLSDGTQVWLNAESSITYPTAFTGKERKVTITGEAYFEVAKDKAKKFIVNVDDKENIEVLGTHFNVNAYKDENSINTTLLEGSVRLSNSVHTSILLKPGQQGQLIDHKLVLAKDPDIEKAVAWKNGVFNFNKATLVEVMRQLSRWYDVDINYEGGKIPDMRFGGKMGRDLKLSQVLKGLEAIGVRYKIDGKKLTVTSSR